MRELFGEMAKTRLVTNHEKFFDAHKRNPLSDIRATLIRDTSAVDKDCSIPTAEVKFKPQALALSDSYGIR